MKTIADILSALKDRLKEREHKYHWVDSWCGDTEAGFHDEHQFDLRKLFEEIDAFGEQLRGKP